MCTTPGCTLYMCCLFSSHQRRSSPWWQWGFVRQVSMSCFKKSPCPLSWDGLLCTPTTASLLLASSLKLIHKISSSSHPSRQKPLTPKWLLHITSFPDELLVVRNVPHHLSFPVTLFFHTYVQSFSWSYIFPWLNAFSHCGGEIFHLVSQSLRSFLLWLPNTIFFHPCLLILHLHVSCYLPSTVLLV